MENPYASPTPSPFSDAAASPKAPPPGARVRGLVGHVRILGILMIVQGILNLIMGMFSIVAAVVIPLTAQLDKQQPPPPENMLPIMIGVYVGIAVITISTGILNCWAGWQVTRFRRRTLGISAISLGMLTIFTCYCGFTSTALLIYGLIVLLDGSVKEAFELGRQGYQPDQIDALFNPWAQAGGWAPPPNGPTPL